MNLAGIVDPQHKDREIVDLLYFPTGGGKTEAYLGLMAFVIANRRLRATDGGEYNLDGGVTVMLRYTLRLLWINYASKIHENKGNLERSPSEVVIWIFWIDKILKITLRACSVLLRIAFDAVLQKDYTVHKAESVK